MDETALPVGDPPSGREARGLDGASSPPPRWRAWAWGLLALAVAALLAAWVQRGMATLDPTARDQVHDMALAIRVREGTALSDGSRHPLLPALLAPVARREPGFFDDAKADAVVLAGLVAFGLFLAAARVYGAGLALLSLLAVVLELRLQARRICPEPLLALCLAAAAATAARAMGRQRGDAQPDHAEGGHKSRPYGQLRFLVAGAFLGLAWLAKGSALLSVGATLLVVLLAGTRRRLACAGLVVLGFAVVASPLLVWNAKQGRSPLYNVNSAHVMWEDAWDVELDQRSDATPASWWGRHGVGDAIEREAGGLGLLGRDRAQRGIEWLYAFLGVMAVGAVVRRWRSVDHAEGDHKGRPYGSEGEANANTDGDDVADASIRAHAAWRRIAVATAIVWLLAMAWYAPVVASRRLLFPVFPVLAPPAFWTLGEIARRLAPGMAAALSRTARMLRWGAIFAAVVGLGAAVALFANAPPANVPDALDGESMEAVSAMRALLPTGSRVLVRPSRTHPPDWLLEGQVRFVGLPGSVADADAWAFVAQQTDATLLNEGLLRSRPGAFQAIAYWDDRTGVTLAESDRRAVLWHPNASVLSRYALRASHSLFR